MCFPFAVMFRCKRCILVNIFPLKFHKDYIESFCMEENAYFKIIIVYKKENNFTMKELERQMNTYNNLLVVTIFFEFHLLYFLRCYVHFRVPDIALLLSINWDDQYKIIWEVRNGTLNANTLTFVKGCGIYFNLLEWLRIISTEYVSHTTWAQ